MHEEKRLAEHLSGTALGAMQGFFETMQGVPAHTWSDMFVGLGYNYEYYDTLFALMAGHVQGSLDESGYTARYRAMQSLLRPFASEYGIEPARPLFKTHRQLYAEFYAAVVGRPLPERYPGDERNPWLVTARRWARCMTDTIACADRPALERAKFNLGYHWAVEHLSVFEFELMRTAWRNMGVDATYLNAHCMVEEEHSGCASEAVFALAEPDDPSVSAAIRTHEAELTGFYVDSARLAAACLSAEPTPR
jgi:hypothetical protein